MTWHKKGKRYEDENGQLNMGHPSDSKAWKNFKKHTRIRKMRLEMSEL
jgi:hypothetical protein